MYHPSNTHPIWSETTSISRFDGPERFDPQTPLEFDVVVIGAGVAGLTAALKLKQAGKRVAVVEMGRIGDGESAHTTAHLTEALDVTYSTLLATFGEEGATLAAQASRRAIDLIEAAALEAKYAVGVDCLFRRTDGYRWTESEKGAVSLELEQDAAARAGVACELVASAPLPFETKAALRFRQQAQFHPLRYLEALARQVHGAGCAIFEETRAVDIGEGDRCLVKTNRGTLVAECAIVATNAPMINKFLLHTKLAAYRTYATAFRLEPDGWRPQGLFWDDQDPYHYVRGAEIDGVEWLIVGGEDHKTGQEERTELPFQRLDDWARDRFDVLRIGPKWSGQVINPVDGLPYIGRNSFSERVFVATGFAGNGMTWGTIAGALTADLALGRENPWQELFDARRIKPWAAARTFLAENIDYPSHLIGDRFWPTTGEGLDVLRENEGAVVRIGANKVAAYRDPQGEVHLLSPVCPHLGCYVGWNDAEKSWDCPCHGSRFDPLGKVINGPSVADLSPQDAFEEGPFAAERYGDPAPGRSPFAPPLFSTFSCPLKAR